MNAFPNKSPRPDWDVSAVNDPTRAAVRHVPAPDNDRWIAAARLIGLHGGDMEAASALLARACRAYYQPKKES